MLRVYRKTAQTAPSYRTSKTHTKQQKSPNHDTPIISNNSRRTQIPTDIEDLELIGKMI